MIRNDQKIQPSVEFNILVVVQKWQKTQKFRYQLDNAWNADHLPYWMAVRFLETWEPAFFGNRLALPGSQGDRNKSGTKGSIDFEKHG